MGGGGGRGAPSSAWLSRLAVCQLVLLSPMCMCTSSPYHSCAPPYRCHLVTSHLALHLHPQITMPPPPPTPCPHLHPQAPPRPPCSTCPPPQVLTGLGAGGAAGASAARALTTAWVEVYCGSEEAGRWVHVDVINALVDRCRHGGGGEGGAGLGGRGFSRGGGGGCRPRGKGVQAWGGERRRVI